MYVNIKMLLTYIIILLYNYFVRIKMTDRGGFAKNNILEKINKN